MSLYFGASIRILHFQTRSYILLPLSIDIINTELLMIGWWKLWKEKVSEKLKVEIKLFGNIALRPMSRMEVVWVWRAITSREIWLDFISAPRKVWSTYCFRLKDLFGFFLCTSLLLLIPYNTMWRKTEDFFQNKKRKLIPTSKVPHFFQIPYPSFIFPPNRFFSCFKTLNLLWEIFINFNAAFESHCRPKNDCICLWPPICIHIASFQVIQ